MKLRNNLRIAQSRLFQNILAFIGGDQSDPSTIVSHALILFGELLKFAAGAVLLAVLVYGYASLVVARRCIGWSLGRIRAMAGATFSLCLESRE